MTSFAEVEALADRFVDMIKTGSTTKREREIIRDALLRGVLQHPYIRFVVANADYST